MKSHQFLTNELSPLGNQILKKQLQTGFQRYKSCSIPNFNEHQGRSAETTPFLHPNVKAKLEVIEKGVFMNKISRVVFSFAIFSLMFYIYVVMEPSQSYKMKHNVSQQIENCSQKFNRHNCSEEHPMSSLCQQLKKCIFGIGEKNKQQTAKKQQKISEIQEILENSLLVFTGMGFMGILAPMFKIKQFFMNTADGIYEVLSKMRHRAEKGVRIAQEDTAP